LSKFVDLLPKLADYSTTKWRSLSTGKIENRLLGGGGAVNETALHTSVGREGPIGLEI
jgi:hypothetical protein